MPTKEGSAVRDEDAVQRLENQLPLLQRQQALPPACADIHRAILRALATRGRPLDRSETAAMLSDRIISAKPSLDVRVGIAWQQPCGHAAHSMCREMIFLVDDEAARAWQGGDTAHKSLFTLDEALDFAGRFFRPLVTRTSAVQ